MITCSWMTLADWATLTAQDLSVFELGVVGAGPTYVRTCDDGTIWMNEVLALTLVGALP